MRVKQILKGGPLDGEIFSGDYYSSVPLMFVLGGLCWSDKTFKAEDGTYLLVDALRTEPFQGWVANYQYITNREYRNSDLWDEV